MPSFRALVRACLVLVTLILSACALDVDETPFGEHPLGRTSDALTTVFQINSGGGAVSPFAADQFFSGGSTFGTGTTVATSGVTN
ncbi:MAG TPA: hypothetical protein VGP93_05965, partial [Polyangiaceae bacterium]|nr:hypothetical protein [Polyangiaceae bacterium]